MTSPDKRNPDNDGPSSPEVTGKPLDAERRADIVFFFIESIKRNPVIWEILNIMPRAGVVNPVQYINVLLLENFGGVDGANFKNHCEKDNEVDPQKLLDLLKKTYNEIVDTLEQADTLKYIDSLECSTSFFNEYPDYDKAEIAQIYQQGFRYIAGMYDVGPGFQEFINDVGVLENRSVERQPVSTPEPAEAQPSERKKRTTIGWEKNPPDNERKKRTTMSWEKNPPDNEKKHESAEGKPLATVGPGPAGQMPQGRHTQRLGLIEPPSTPPPSTRHTQRLAGAEDGGRIVADNKEDAISHLSRSPSRRSSIPVSMAMVEKLMMPRHETLHGIPIPLVSELEKESLGDRGVDASAPPSDPAMYWDNPHFKEEEASRPSLHSFNPPPPVSDIRGLIADLETALGAMKNLADQQFRRMFIREFRVLCLKNDVKDNIGERFLDEAVEKVLTITDDVDTNDADAPCKDIRNLYYGSNFTPDQRFAELREVARQVMSELPKMKAEAFTELADEFTGAFESRYPIKGAKMKRDEMFLPVFKRTVRDVNKRMKTTPDKFESYKLYYPSGHMSVIEELTMAIARGKAIKQLPTLDLPIEAYLKINKKTIDTEILSVSPEELEELFRAINWLVLEWLYRVLPKEKADADGNNNRIWLNYFFKSQSRPDKLQIDDCDELIDPIETNETKIEPDAPPQSIGTQICKTVREYCIGVRLNANLPLPEVGANETKRVDLGALLAQTPSDDRLRFDENKLLNSPVTEDIAANEENAEAAQTSPVEAYNAESEVGGGSVFTQTADALAAVEKSPPLDTIFNLDDDDEKMDSEEQPTIVGAPGADAILKLEITREDQKAQEFRYFANVLSGRTTMPILDSIPPQGNDGDVYPRTGDLHIPPQPPLKMMAPIEEVSGNASTVEHFEPLEPEQTEDVPEPEVKAPARQSWARRHLGKIVAAAAVAGATLGGFYAYQTTQNFEKQSTPIASATPTTKSTHEVKVALNAPSTSADVKTAPTTAPDPKNAQTPENAAGDKLSVTPEMIASVKNPELKKILTEKKFEVKANGGGYGQQIRSYFDAEINYKLVNREITPEQAKEMTRQLDELQQKVNFGAAVSYYERYGHMSYGEVNAKRSNQASDSLFTYLDRNNKNAGMGKWETWRAQYGNHSKMAGAQEAKKYFEEKYEHSLMSFGYDQRSPGNIHWGAQPGDERRVENEKGEWLPYFAECANVVLGGNGKSVDIDLGQIDTDEKVNGANHAPAVNPANGAVPEFAPMDGGTPDNGSLDGGNFGKTGMLNRNEYYDDGAEIEVTGYTEIADDRVTEVTLTDVEDADETSFAGIVIPFAVARRESRQEDPTIETGEEVEIDLSELDDDTPEITISETEIDLSDLEESTEINTPTLEEKIAAVKKNRRQSLLENGEVFVPPLNEDMDGSVKLAFENGFLMQCVNETQQNKVAALIKNIRFRDMVEFEATENGTYARLSPEKFSQLKEALEIAEEPAKSVGRADAPVVEVRPPTSSEAREVALADLEDGWDEIIKNANQNPMDVRFGIRNGLNDTVPGVIRNAA